MYLVSQYMTTMRLSNVQIKIKRFKIIPAYVDEILKQPVREREDLEELSVDGEKSME